MNKWYNLNMANYCQRLLKSRSGNIMFKKTFIAGAMLMGASLSIAAETPIEGSVESKCVITTDTVGVYGNPVPYKLSTTAADGGVEPVIRYDVISADYYKASIDYPDEFTTSPTLTDVVNWTGSVSTESVSDAAMSAYDTNKVEFNNTTEFELTVAGSVWFKVSSAAEYGYNKSFPAGNYSAVVSAECIAI